MKSPWSKIPVLSLEDQIAYNEMRQRAELQERIDQFDVKAMVDSPQPSSYERMGDMDDVVEWLADILRKKDGK